MTPEQLHRRKFWRKFLFGISLMILGLGTWAWAVTHSERDGIASPLRSMHEWNERVSRFVFGAPALAPTFDKSLAVKNPRVNGQIGMEDPNFNLATWELDLRGNGKRVSLKMDDIKKLTAVDMTTEFKCIEGWSEIIHWTGPRLSELLEKYGVLSADDRAHGYVALSTPDEEYYVGLDMESALHPQTLLAYAMNDQPLTLEHGAPLRLAIPTKYGIKNIKRIGHITVGPDRASDYWEEQGYDWYSGH